MDEHSSSRAVPRRGTSRILGEQTSQRWFERPALWSGDGLPPEPSWNDRRPDKPDWRLWFIIAFYSGCLYILASQWALKKAKEHKH